MLVVALAGLTAPTTRADELINETFTGATVADPSFSVGGTNFGPCLTASVTTTQAPVPGCAAGAVSLPPGGDPPGSGALRLTDNGTGRAGFVFYNRALPLTAGVQVDFDFFAYRGNGATGADGLAFFLADGNVNLTQPGGYGGALGYAPNRVNGQHGLAGGYIGLGLDEYGNYSNASTEGTGCPPNPAVGFRPQSVALRGPGSGLSGYCLIGTTAVGGFGGLSRPAATSRTAAGVLHSARLVIDPLGRPGAQLTVSIDFHDGAGLRQVFQAPLPPNPPSTFKFGFAAATGGSVNIHEIRFLRVSTVDELPRLTLTKVHSGGGVVAGTVHDFELQATVSGAPGDGPEQAPVTITDSLPAGDTVAALPTGTGWDCSATVVGSGTAACTYQASVTAPLAPGTVLAAVTVPVRIAPDHAGTYVNTAVAGSGDNANTPQQSSASDSYVVTQQADLVQTKTAAPSPVPVGEPVTYTLIARNAGPSTANTVVVRDTLPEGMTFVSASPDCTWTGDAVVCTVGSLAVDGSAPFQIVTRAGASIAGQTVTNTATVTADQPDPDPDNNRAIATVEVGRLADLSVRKSAPSSPLVPGTVERFDLLVTNDGPSAASNVRVEDLLPEQFAFVSASPECAEAAGTLSCTVASLAPGASHTFTVTGRVASSLDGCLENTATVASDTPDPDAADNRSTVCAPIEGHVDLQITKTPSRAALPLGGGQVIYTLVVENDGPSDATGVTVTDPLAAGLTLVSATPAAGNCATTDNTVSCDLGGLAAGGSTQVLVTVNTWATAGEITNTARVDADQLDTDPANDQDAATVTVTASPAVTESPPHDLVVEKTVDDSTPVIGQPTTYRILVTNTGPGAAPGVNLTDTLTAPVRIVSVDATAGSCTKAIPMSCSLGTIAPGASVTVTVVAKHRRAMRGQLNAASATGAGNDTNPSDNLGGVSASVRRVALKVTKVASRQTVGAGETLVYRIRVRNRTKGEARRVEVCDRLPSGMAFAGATPNAKRRVGRRCWTIERLGAGQRRSFRVTVRVARGASGRKTNRAIVTSPDSPPSHARRAVRVRGVATPVTG
jgi:uncharacterized repeat protein (TIGR01451 family)